MLPLSTKDKYRKRVVIASGDEIQVSWIETGMNEINAWWCFVKSLSLSI